jgi:hypothetical protein
MASILTPGYLRWDGTKYVLDPGVEIVGATGPAGPPGDPGPPGPAGPSGGGNRTLTIISDNDYTVLPTDDIIEWNIPLSGTRNAYLPLTPSIGEHYTFKVNDLTNGNHLYVNGNVYDVDRPGSTSPATSAQLSTSHMSYTFVFNGTKWIIVDVFPLPQTNCVASGSYSIALGQGNQASNTGAIALGGGCYASGYVSLAFGSACTSSGIYAIAMGNGCTAGADSAVAIGESNTISGVSPSSTAFGTTNIINDSGNPGFSGSSFASGEGNICSNYLTFCIGKSNAASGDTAFAFGLLCTASGSESFSFGSGNTSSGTNSYTFGLNCTSQNTNTVAIGFTSKAKNLNSIAIGTSCEAQGDYSAVIGRQSFTFGARSHAIGSFCSAGADESLAIGYACSTSAARSSAIGYNNSATAEFANAAGSGSIAQVIGQYAYSSIPTTLEAYIGHVNVTGTTPGSAIGESVELGNGIVLQFMNYHALLLRFTVLAASPGSFPGIPEAYASFAQDILVKRIAGTTTIVASGIQTPLNDGVDGASWTFAVTAGAGPDRIVPTFTTGLNKHACHINARIDITEIKITT